MVDQEGGISEGSPYFYDYLLDWSAPGGNGYPSGFNYSFAPLGRHDVSGSSTAILGSSANTAQMNPPIVNDPLTAIWYLSYLLADEDALPGDLFTFMFGDTGSVDPPQDDPDNVPWYHIMDSAGGLPATHTELIANDAVAIAIYSQEPGAPDPESLGMPGQYDSGDLVTVLRQYPFQDPGSNIYWWGLHDWTTDNQPAPVFQAFDVSDPSRCRLTADTDSYLVTGWVDPSEDFAVPLYMIDSSGNWYGTLFEMEYSEMRVHYLIWDAIPMMRPDDDPDDLYLDGATMIDLEVLPSHDQGLEDLNWCAVLYDDGAGNFVVRVYFIDWTVSEDRISIIDTTDPIPGTPLAIDVDAVNFVIHVLADNAGTIEGTTFDYTP